MYGVLLILADPTDCSA